MQVSEKQVDVGEHKINYALAGRGDPVLLLHGSEPSENWRVWEPILPLADSYTVVAPDLLGRGLSARSAETPDFVAQANAMKDLAEKLSLGRFSIIGGGWGGQVALELALTWPGSVRALVLIASSYDVGQLARLQKMRRPTLIVYAEDDMVTQLKAAYVLRDAIGTSRLEILSPVARDPRYDFRMSHRLQRFRAPQVLQLVRSFLSRPEEMIAEPPEMENELKGMALRKDEGSEPKGATETP